MGCAETRNRGAERRPGMEYMRLQEAQLLHQVFDDLFLTLQESREYVARIVDVNPAVAGTR